MYKCLDCGEEFLEPRVCHETVPYGGGEAELPEYFCCPFCGGAYKEEKQCEYCGKFFLEDESRMDVMCEECLDELKERFSALLHNNFTPYEIKALNTIFDGRDLG